MSAMLESIREEMTRYLTGQGLNAISAWPKGDRLEQRDAVIAVSLRKCQGGPAGFQDYLGERFNEEKSQWEELYGKKVKLTFGLDIYAPQNSGEEAVERTFDRLASALQQGGPAGLELEELSCGESSFLTGERFLKRSVQAVCSAFVYAVAQPDGAFLDFEIRGGMKQ